MTISPSCQEPDPAVRQLAPLMQIVMRVGVLMLRSGTVGFRVEQAMQRVAIGLGIERLDAYVTLTGITASAHRGDCHYTQVARVKSIGVDMNRLSAVEALSHQVLLTADPLTLTAILDKIEQAPPLYPLPLVIAMMAIACGAFAMLSGGSWIDCLAALLGAGVGQTLRTGLNRSRLNPIASTVLCATVATLCCYGAMQAGASLGWATPTPQSGFVASVLFLVPGMPLVTAALDLARFDLISGMARVAYGLILMIAVAIGILLAMACTGLSIL